jgi:hypothetical protein
MNNDGTEIEEVITDTPEGAVSTEPTTSEIGDMYKELGIKAPAPTGATKGRPKSDTVRAKDVQDDDDADTKSGRKDDKPSTSKSKDALASASNGDAGDDSDAKGSKVSKASAKVSDEPEEADDGVRDAKSAAKEDSERGSKEDTEQGTDGTRQAEHESDDEAEEGEDVEGKRPGKSNPKVEQRFQKLSSDVRERDELIEKLQQELQATTRKHEDDKVAQEDPEYSTDDFRKVRDEEGNVLDLDVNQAELAYRRWQDGFEGRKSEREAARNHEQAIETDKQEASEKLMRSSVEAYDTLTNLLGSYPELDSKSDKFDQDFSNAVLPVIEESIIYQEGTEPGNEEGITSVIVGLHMNPKKMLDAMNLIKSAKRTLPLNGVNDNVEVRSNVNVPHGRSSDATVQAANELMKELKINKRF